MLALRNHRNDLLQKLKPSVRRFTSCSLHAHLDEFLCTAVKNEISCKPAGRFFLFCLLAVFRFVTCFDYLELFSIRVLTCMSKFMQQVEKPASVRHCPLFQHNDITVIYSPACAMKNTPIVE